ncbi:MAG: hypothetical protein Q4A84_10745 [Neisseria sp.]|uniref:hypothetical protein n=1 Tax=Neisseria sp. TaxID=192066 RepID=UPI0026DC112A|nr:hypothetical protein [Neisseria sp.]MDO4642156.1 hypothetical protein [Neisseria sp.]
MDDALPRPLISTRLLLLSGVFAAVCWSVADMLLLGFVQSPQRYPLFSQTLFDRLGGNVGLAMLMLDASPLRLLWGVLFATFSAIFYLAAAMLGGATLNLAQLIFFLCAYCLTEK